MVLSSFFSHDPLDLSSPSIRLLEVLPGRSEDGKIRCKIRHSTISDKYTCLSYVWGSVDLSTDMRDIEINGLRFKVRENLWSFLELASSKSARSENLRLQKTDKYEGGRPFCFESATKSMWIDALCIDQGNVVERNAQVQQMGSIYKNAKHVLSWLGRSKQAELLLKRMRDKEEDKYPGKELAASIKWFDSHVYWTRAWITQEVLMAPSLLVVAERDAVFVSAALMYLKRYRVLYDFPVQNNSQCQILLYSHYRDAAWSLLDSLAAFRDKECENPRDKVYSLLSTCNDTNWLKVNYNISKGSLAIDVMRNCTKKFCLCVAEVVISAIFSEEPISPLHVASFQGEKIPSSAPKCIACQESLDAYSIEESFKDAKLFCFCLSCKHGNLNRSDNYSIHYGHLLIVKSSSMGPRTFHLHGDYSKISKMYTDVTEHIQPRSVPDFVRANAKCIPQNSKQASSTTALGQNSGTHGQTHLGYIDLLGLWYLVRLNSPRFRKDEADPKSWESLPRDLILDKSPLESQKWIFLPRSPGKLLLLVCLYYFDGRKLPNVNRVSRL